MWLNNVTSWQGVSGQSHRITPHFITWLSVWQATFLPKRTPLLLHSYLGFKNVKSSKLLGSREGYSIAGSIAGGRYACALPFEWTWSAMGGRQLGSRCYWRPSLSRSGTGGFASYDQHSTKIFPSPIKNIKNLLFGAVSNSGDTIACILSTPN